ncbi:hypothetical protein Patl1_31960 [Pistacia atlantica]|uniref:Uncharacterized protein n=1 Tax=Pistacia atlantica TaxID=434234 RepID=A0ACC1APQ1_9ROSI|nr:hypothetical protein Patl1_31960 [Pistacia atlantica]
MMIKNENLIPYLHLFLLSALRIDAEACSLMEKIDKLKPIQQLSNEGDKLSEELRLLVGLYLESYCSDIQGSKRSSWANSTVFQVGRTLVKEKSLSNGDSPELHAEKVHKLKIFAESLANSTSQAEKRILDHRFLLNYLRTAFV